MWSAGARRHLSSHAQPTRRRSISTMPNLDTVLKSGLFAGALTAFVLGVQQSEQVSAQHAKNGTNGTSYRIEAADDAKEMASFMAEHFGKTASP